MTQPHAIQLIRQQQGPIPGRLRIGPTIYRYFLIDSPEAVAHVRLEKLGIAWRTIDVYDAAIDREGRRTCSCGDFTFRGEQAGRTCKHLEALTTLGILPVLAREHQPVGKQ